MSVADVLVLVVAVVAIVGLVWFFFGPRRAGTAELAGGVQGCGCW
jgi:Cu+-exporting ATPase